MVSIDQELIETIEAYGITAKDLGLGVGRARKAKGRRKLVGAKIARTGKTCAGPDGRTWSEGTRMHRPA